MSIIEVVSENAWNIVIGIATGVISGILVSKIFLIYQDIKSDFIEVVKNTTALKNCKIFYNFYKNPELAKAFHVKLQDDGTVSKELTFLSMERTILNEVKQLHNIYTKYMDKKLIEIKNEYEANLDILQIECEKQFRREDSIKSIFSMTETTLNKFDEYQKNMFKRTMFLILKDKLIIFLAVFFTIMILIAQKGYNAFIKEK